jgi:hypothetical protein
MAYSLVGLLQGMSLVTSFFGGNGCARQHGAIAIEQRYRIPRRHLRGYPVAKQPVDRIFNQQHARKTLALVHGDVQLQQRRVVSAAGALHVHRLVQFAGLGKATLAVAAVERFVALVHQVGGGNGAALAEANAPALVEPGHTLQLGVLVEHGIHARFEVFQTHVAVGQFARHAHELFLALQQAQAQALLGVFHIALHGLLLAVNFFQLQIRQRGDDGGKKQKNRQQRGQHGETILALGG